MNLRGIDELIFPSFASSSVDKDSAGHVVFSGRMAAFEYTPSLLDPVSGSTLEGKLLAESLSSSDNQLSSDRSSTSEF